MADYELCEKLTNFLILNQMLRYSEERVLAGIICELVSGIIKFFCLDVLDTTFNRG